MNYETWQPKDTSTICNEHQCHRRRGNPPSGIPKCQQDSVVGQEVPSGTPQWPPSSIFLHCHPPAFLPATGFRSRCLTVTPCITPQFTCRGCITIACYQKDLGSLRGFLWACSIDGCKRDCCQLRTPFEIWQISRPFVPSVQRDQAHCSSC